MSAEERIKVLSEAPPLSWVAFSADESAVVAKGGTYDEVVVRAEKQGVADPVLVMIPASWQPLVLMP